MGSTDTPEQQPKRNQGQRGGEQPQAVFGFHDAALFARKVDDEPVAKFARVRSPNKDADQGADVGQADHGAGKVVRAAREDE